MANARLLIVQPYVPKYRIGFFDQLISELDSDGVTCRVAAGEPPHANVLRGDAAQAAWLTTKKRRRVRALDRSVGTLGSGALRRGADAVIVGLEGSSLDTYGALLQRWTRHTRVGLWGHVKSYVNVAHPLDQRLERWQARHADHVFAYTGSGAQQAARYGVDAARITTVMNSVDMSPTIDAVRRVRDQDVLLFQERHGIDPAKTACFIGGLDRAKRVGFLQQALDEIWEKEPGFKLLVGGGGEDSYMLQPSVNRGQVIMLGFAGPSQKALMARCSRALAMPGRIGLVAVESLALGLPVVTTKWPFHAPEFEYLSEGSTCFSSEDQPAAFSRLLLQVVRDAKTAHEGQIRYPTVSDMVANFRRGVLTMLAQPKSTAYPPVDLGIR